MPLTVRTVIGVMAVSAGAAGAIAAWAIDDIPLPLPPMQFELEPTGGGVLRLELEAIQPRHEGLRLQRGIFEAQRGIFELQLEPQRPGGVEHAPRPYRRVIEVLAPHRLPAGRIG